MTEFIFEWLMIISIVLMAAASPGPDFLITIRNSVSHSRRAGMFTALGIGTGNGIQIALCILGIAATIASSVMAFNIIKYVGAAYLVYIGIKALKSQGYENKAAPAALPEDRNAMNALQAYKTGLFTNLLNPKAMMFFIALFTQVIDPQTSAHIQILYGFSAALIVTIWFMLVSFLLTARRVKNSFISFSKWIDRVCGGLLVALGVRLAFSKNLVP